MDALHFYQTAHARAEKCAYYDALHCGLVFCAGEL